MDDTNTPLKPLLDLKQTATALAISEVKLRRMLKAKDGPKVRRIGKSLRFRPEDVAAYVEAR